MKKRYYLLFVLLALLKANTGAVNFNLNNLHLLAPEPIEVTITGTFTVNNKTYDGDNSAVIATDNLELSGVTGDDDVTLENVVAEFSDKNAGEEKSVTITSAELGGANAADYILSLTGAPTTTAAITQKELTVINAK